MLLGFGLQQNGPSQENIDLLPLVAACVKLSAEAADLGKEIFESGDLQVVDKSDPAEFSSVLPKEQEAKADNPQTLADRTAQQHIVTGLKTRFSSRLRIIGEEDRDVVTRVFQCVPPDDGIPEELKGATMPQQYVGMSFENVQVLIDPLDGTKEYTSGNNAAAREAGTVLIGICLAGRPVAGVITRVFTGESLFGIVDVGWYCTNMTAEKKANLVTIRESRDKAHKDRRVVCTTKSHGDEKLEKYVADCAATSVVRSGGCGGKVFLMFEGKADAYVFPKAGTKKWDTAGPEAILIAYGGLMTQPNGELLEYSNRAEVGTEEMQNQSGLIATWCGGRDRNYHNSFCKYM
jgi:3'(2'), 5'-bisphosphate nucleotidase